MIRFNERFKEAREYFGMNKADFAKKLKISATTVARYESGSMDIAMGSINDVAGKLGIRLEWLLGLSENMFDADIEYKNIPILNTVKKKPVFDLKNYEGFEILKGDYDVDFCIKENNKTYFVKRQDSAENEDMVAIIDGDAILVAKYIKLDKNDLFMIESKKTSILDIVTIIGRVVYEFSEVGHGELQETR
jgi:transcriptional regulator with XRE-family HTH domain